MVVNCEAKKMESKTRKIKTLNQFSESFMRRNDLQSYDNDVTIYSKLLPSHCRHTIFVPLFNSSPKLKAISVVVCFSHIATTLSTHANYLFLQ